MGILKTSLRIHGIGVSVRASAKRYASLFENLEHDFDYFSNGGNDPLDKCDLVIRIKSAATRPTWALRKSRLYKPTRREQRICFFGKAWVAYRFAEGECEIYCDDPVVAYEVCYLVVLSYSGERLDRKGLHRIHGLGMVINGTGLLILAPSGTGKSTLAFQVLKQKKGFLLSDDTPLVGRHGIMRAFPQRIGLKEDPKLAGDAVRVFSRVNYGEKFVVSGSFFRSRILSDAKVNWLVLMKRSRVKSPYFEPVPRYQLVWPLIKWLVVGYETPQVWELFLRSSFPDVLKKIEIAGRRCLVAAELLASARPAAFHLSEDPAQCGQALRQFNGEQN